VPRLTAAERLDREQTDRRLERYRAQEAARAPRPQVDRKWNMIGTAILAGLMWLASAILVANGTVQVAEYMGLAQDWFRYLAFGAIELAVLVFMAFYLFVGSRSEEDGDGPKAARPWFYLMIGFSAITILANVYHTLEFHEFDWSKPQLYVGAMLSAVIPLSFVLAVKGLSRVVFAQPIRLEA
jgi:hypothetical protein